MQGCVGQYLEWLPLLPLCSRSLPLAPSVQPSLRSPPRQSVLITEGQKCCKTNRAKQIQHVDVSLSWDIACKVENQIVYFVESRSQNWFLYGEGWGLQSVFKESVFQPAGNSRVQHPIGGRNCFTITTQSLCSVRFSRARIPTPVGFQYKTCYTHTMHTNTIQGWRLLAS